MLEKPSEVEGNKGALLWLWLSLIVILLDQMTKSLASTFLLLGSSVPIFPSFNFTLLHNTGAAFSLLAQAGEWTRWFLTLLALVVSSIIVLWLHRLKVSQRWLACALALILGGAVGNVIDRLIYGYVIDFIDIYYQIWHWPAFNIADSAISVGAVMLAIDALFETARENK